MNHYIIPLISFVALSSTQAALVFTTDNATLNAGEDSFVSIAGNSFNFTTTGQNDGLATNGVVTGSISTTATGGTWRPVADEETTSSAPNGSGNFQAIDFRPAGNVLGDGESISFTIMFDQALSNGDSDPTLASIAVALRNFGFTSPPAGLEVGITATGSIDLTSLVDESDGVLSSIVGVSSATTVSDMTTSNEFLTAFRDPSSTSSDGTVTGWMLTITNNSGADWDNSPDTPPLFRLTFDGAVAVPEPSGTLLLSLAALGLCSRRRRS